MKELLRYILILFVLTGCKTEQLILTPTYNKGGYTIKMYKSKHLASVDSVYIGGSVFDNNKKELLKRTVVKYGCSNLGDKFGSYSIRTIPYDVSYPLVSRYIGYLDVETAPYQFQAGDSVIINFYIAQDERALIHCDGY